VPTVRTGPLVGFAGQLAILAGLAATVGLGPAGWLAGLGYGLVVLVLLRRARLGPADRVTLARSALVGGVTALVADAIADAVSGAAAGGTGAGGVAGQARVAGGAAGLGAAGGTGGIGDGLAGWLAGASPPEPLGVLIALAAVALALDAVDGWVARRTGTVSTLGARFDMEVDAFLILVLAGYVTSSLGGWVLALGVMRYAFAAAGWVVPWMRAELPPRYWRKVVAATQGVVLVVAASGLPPRPVAVAVVAVGLALLAESFGRDVGWLWRRARMVKGPVHGSVRGGPVRPRGHADPADRQRRGAAARGGGHAGGVPRPRRGHQGLAAGARPQ
jgi:phosphatidylglycerophosphate synthase